MNNQVASRLLIAALFASVAMSACSKPADAPAPAADAATPAAPAESVAVSAPERKVACELVTAGEMSTILGAEVSATPNEGSANKTVCNYKPVADTGPSVELSVDWGVGDRAMAAMGGMGDEESADAAGPYAGIGDKAFAIGPTVMILNGEDMFTIMIAGIDDTPAATRKIFETAKARM